MPAFRSASLLFVVLLVGFYSPASAQQGVFNLHVETITDDKVDAIHQDRNGLVWVASGSKVRSYDGSGYRTYQHLPFDTTSISNGLYYAIASSADGGIWLGTATSGVNRMTGYGGRIQRWDAFPQDPRGLTASSVTGMLIDSQERVWVATTRGLNRFEEQEGKFLHYRNDSSNPASIPGDYVGDIVEDKSGSIWLGTSRGLARLDVGTGSFERFPFRYDLSGDSGPAYEHVRSIFIDDADRIWIVITQDSFGPRGHAQGLFGLLVRFDQSDASFQVHEFIESDEPVGVSSILQNHQGQFWAATERGLAAFDPDTGTFTVANLWSDSNEKLGDIQITNLVIDSDDGLWIRSPAGVARLTMGRTGIEAHSTSGSQGLDRLSEGWVDAVIASDDNSTIWFSTGIEPFGSPNGFTRLDRATGRETQYRHDPTESNSLSHDYVLEIVERSDGKLWIGGPGGLNLFDPSTENFTHYYIDGEYVSSEPGHAASATSSESGFEPNRIAAIALVSDDELWVATQGQGAVHVDVKEGRKDSYSFETPFPERIGHVEDILVAKTGLVWMVIAGGVAWLDPETGQDRRFFYDPTEPTSVGAGNGTSIHEDGVGRIWVSSHLGGLSLFEPETETWKHYGFENGLPSNTVSCVTHDDAGDIWVSTFHGISRLDLAREVFENFSTVDGIQGRRFAGDACSRSVTGKLFFGGQHGFNIIQPRLVTQSSVLPKVILTTVAVSGAQLRPGLDGRLPLPLSETDVIRLDYAGNNLIFEYAGIDFGHAGSRDFEYRLEPLDTKWRAAGAGQSAAYANLNPGVYTFMVRVRVEGRMSPTPASIKIEIAPPWWGTLWAYCLFGLGAMSILYGGYRYRVRRMEAHSEKLEEQVAERTHDLEEEKHKTEEQSRQLLELDETKNRFFANISHEFRTPLTLIIGPIQDAIEGAFDDDPDELRRQHGVVLRSAGRLLRLINQLLDLSKLESHNLELMTRPGDIVTFLQGLCGAFTPSAERRRISFGFQSDHKSQPCLFDEDKIEKIVSNLISNALKFTPLDGKVAVELKTHENAETVDVQIIVRDTGRGIAPANLDRIFDRFQQVDTSTSRQYEGTGIGLSLAKELTELHGGSISVESQVGFGTTFRVQIPLEKMPAEIVLNGNTWIPAKGDPAELTIPEKRENPDNDECRGDGSQGVVLIVEDNPEIREYVRSHLTADYRIIEAENGEEGLASAKEHRPDLILSDIMMPKMDGYEMVRRIRKIEELRHVPIVMLTAKAGEGEAVEGLGSGADDFITKPFGASELKARILGLISKQREMRERFSGEVVVKGADIVVTSDDAVFLQTVTEVIDTYLANSDFGADWLADEVGMSRRQLERKLDSILEESPAALIRRLRLERASQLLRAHSGTVAEIGYSVGFTSPAYFARAFRKAYGESPTEHGK